MPLDPNISLSYQPPQIQNPLQTIGAVQALKNQQLQGQSAQLELQQQQLQMQQQQAVMSAFANSGGDMDKALHEISTTAPLQYIALRGQQANLTKLYDEHAKAAREDALYQNDMAGRDAQYVLDAPDDLKPYAYLAKRPQWVKANPALDQQLPQAWTPGLEPILQGIAKRSQSLKDQAQTQQAQAATQESQEKTKLTAAETVKQQRINDMQATALANFKNNPDAGNAVIDSVFPPSLDATTNAALRARWKNAMQMGNVEDANAAVAQAAQHAATFGQLLNPTLQQQKVTEAVNVEKATSPLKVAQSVATAKALRMGDNPAVAGVAPASVTAVQNAAMKLDEDYLKAKGTAESLGHVLDLAQSGNKEAGSNLPLVGVETLNALNGIKRINSAEISQYGSAGSLLDKIQGKIKGLTTGQPIPQDVMDDIRQLHQQLATDSYNNYTQSLGALNSRSGAKFGPVAEAPNLSRGGGKGAQYSMTANGPGGHQIGSNDGQTWYDLQTGKRIQ